MKNKKVLLTLIFPVINIIVAVAYLVYYKNDLAFVAITFSGPMIWLGGVIPLGSILIFKTDISHLLIPQAVINTVSLLLFITEMQPFTKGYAMIWAPIMTLAAGITYGITAKRFGKWITAFLTCPAAYWIFPYIMFIVIMSGYRE